jgi:hypothetical protein
MTSLPQPFQGVADKSARAATPSGLSRLASSSAKLASTNAEDALRSLISFLEADSGSSKAVLRAAEIAGAALPPEPDQPLESIVFWATDFGIYGKVSITLPVNNGGDEQFDADFEDTMAFVKAVVGRRKEARAKAMEARQGRDGEAGSVEDDSAARQGLPEEPRS